MLFKFIVQSIDRLIDWSIFSTMYRLIDWLIDWLHALQILYMLPFLLLSSRYIRDILEQLSTNVAVELQQRGAEYTSLFERPQQFRFGILERMPVIKRGSAADHSLSDVDGGGIGGLTVPHADDTDDLLGYHGEQRDASKKPKPKHSDVRLFPSLSSSVLCSRPSPVPVIPSHNANHLNHFKILSYHYQPIFPSS